MRFAAIVCDRLRSVAFMSDRPQRHALERVALLRGATRPLYRADCKCGWSSDDTYRTDLAARRAWFVHRDGGSPYR